MPSSIALLIQITAFIVSSALSAISLHFTSHPLPMLILIVIHCLTAGALSILLHKNIWWRFIHFLFPIAVIVTLNLHIPSYLFMMAFIVSGLTFWKTFNGQVPFYPCSASASALVAELISPKSSISIMEVGSGLGDFSIKLSKIIPHATVEGVEIAPLPWFISRLKSSINGGLVKFRLGNYNRLNLSKYDVIFAYLSPLAIHPLWKKVVLEMKPGSLLISYEFAIDNVRPSKVIADKNASKFIYIYQL